MTKYGMGHGKEGRGVGPISRVGQPGHFICTKVSRGLSAIAYSYCCQSRPPIPECIDKNFSIHSAPIRQTTDGVLSIR